MKTRKAFLAKVLAVAVAITSVLPGGALTAKAAPQLQTTESSKWMYMDDNGVFKMSPENWLDASTNEQADVFGDVLTIGSGLQTWHFSSSSTSGNGHEALSEQGAAACAYASGMDISSKGVRRIMTFDLVPLSNADKLRFGIMLKYVDADHWAYLGYDAPGEGASAGNWYIQWKLGDEASKWSSDYPHTDKDGDEVAAGGENEAFSSIKFENNKYVRVQIVYESSTDITVTITPLASETDEDGNVTLTPNEEGAKEAALSYSDFGGLREYANEQEKEIYFGFIGGTFNGAVTDMNIVNVQNGAYAENSDTLVEPMTAVKYNNCKWKTPKPTITNIEDIITRQAVGTVETYASIGDIDGTAPADTTIYSKFVTGFEEGKISADLRPYRVGKGKEFYLGVMSPEAPEALEAPETPEAPETDSATAQAPKAVRVGIKNDKWVCDVDGKVTELGSEPQIKEESDYDVHMAIDKDGKLTAKVGYFAKARDLEMTWKELITSENAIDVKGISGSVALTTKGEVLRVRNVTCDKVSYGKTPLEVKVAELEAANANNEIYTDVWAAFAEGEGALAIAKAAVESSDDVLTPGQPEADSYNEAIAAVLQGAFDEINVNENKVATGKTNLTAAIAAAQAILDSDTKEDYYTADSLAAYEAAKTAAEAVLAKIDAEDFAGITKTEVTEAINSLSEENLEENKATADDIAKLAPAIAAALEGVDLENDGDYYTAATWAEFTAAVAAAQALTEEGAEPSLKDVNDAIAALAAAKTGLSALSLGSAALATFKDEVAKVTEEFVTAEYFEENDAWTTYQAKVTAANAITADSSKKEADTVLAELQAARAALTEKAADKAAAQSRVDAVKAEVAAKKYLQDEKWTAYQDALKAAEDLIAAEGTKKYAMDQALAALDAAKGELNADPNGNNDNNNNNNNNNQTPPPAPAPAPAPAPTLKAGQTAKDKNGQYKVLDAAKKTVTLTKSLSKKSSKTIKVPAKVKVNGVSCTVTAIGKNAFKGFSKATKVTIPKNITKVDANAFAGCKKLKTIDIKNAKIKVAKNAFKGANTKATVKVPAAVKKKKASKKKFEKMMKAAGIKKVKIK